MEEGQESTESRQQGSVEETLGQGSPGAAASVDAASGSDRRPGFARRLWAQLRGLPAGFTRGRVALVALAGRFWVWFVGYTRSLDSSPRARFLTLAWGLCLAFLATAMLSASNPLRLLVPGVGFSIPVRDQRPALVLFAVSEPGGELVPLRRRVLVSEQPDLMARRILIALCRPPSVQVNEADDFRDLVPLPQLAPAIRQIWFRRGTIIVDLRSSSLREELRRMAENRRPKREAPAYMEAFVRGYSMSVLERVPKVQKVQFLFDGEVLSWPQLRIDTAVALDKSALSTLSSAEPSAKAASEKKAQ